MSTVCSTEYSVLTAISRVLGADPEDPYAVFVQHSTEEVQNSYKISEIRTKGSQCTYNVTWRCVRVTIVAVGKIIVTYSECVFVALVTQHKLRMHLIVICNLSGSAIFFPHRLS